MKIVPTLLTIGTCLSSMQVFSQTESFSQLLQARHSGYSFDPNKAVSSEQIQKLIEAARTTPSCYNDQPWRFIIINRQKNLDDYNKVLNSLVEANQKWAKDAPVLIIIAADSKFRHNGKENRWGSYDTGAAAYSMMLAATDQGLMTHQMGGFDEKKLQKDLNIPSQFEIMSVMALGYETPGAEIKPRNRRPVEENFFFKGF